MDSEVTTAMGALLSVSQESAFHAMKMCVIINAVDKKAYACLRIDMATDEAGITYCGWKSVLVPKQKWKRAVLIGNEAA